MWRRSTFTKIESMSFPPMTGTLTKITVLRAGLLTLWRIQSGTVGILYILIRDATQSSSRGLAPFTLTQPSSGSVVASKIFHLFWIALGPASRDLG